MEPPSSLCARVLRREPRAISRAITLVEQGDSLAQALVAALYPHTGQAQIIGLTGAPGTGKSTLVNALARAYRDQGLTVGVIAVDPTSPFTGGAILGDRIRLQALRGDARFQSDPGLFFRSMATRGSLGGLSRATADALRVLDAAGFDKILLETVGAGQAEVEIARMAHTTLVLQVPGLGDDIQAIKAGILEIADLLVVNKADREGAEQVVRTLEGMLDLAGPARRSALPAEEYAPPWRPPVLQTVATRQEGIGALTEAIQRHLLYLQESGCWAAREQARASAELLRLLQEALWRRFRERLDPEALRALVEQVASRELDPYTAVARLLEEPSSF